MGHLAAVQVDRWCAFLERVADADPEHDHDGGAGTEEPWQIELLQDGLLTGPCHGPVQRRRPRGGSPVADARPAVHVIDDDPAPRGDSGSTGASWIEAKALTGTARIMAITASTGDPLGNRQDYRHFGMVSDGQHRGEREHEDALASP